MNVPRSCVTPATCRPALNRHHGFMKTVCSFENVRKPGFRIIIRRVQLQVHR